MPRYQHQEQTLDPRLAKLAALQALSPPPADNTGDLVAMLAHLYGIHQDQQEGPAKLAALQANTQKDLASIESPEETQARIRHLNSQSDYYDTGHDARAMQEEMNAVNVALPNLNDPRRQKLVEQIGTKHGYDLSLSPEAKPQGAYDTETLGPPAPPTSLATRLGHGVKALAGVAPNLYPGALPEYYGYQAYKHWPTLKPHIVQAYHDFMSGLQQ